MSGLAQCVPTRRRRKLGAVVDKLVAILSEDVEHERARGEGAGRRIRQRPTRLARPRVDAHIGVRPSSREIWLEEGTNQSSEPAGRWDQERGPCETDDVTRAEFRRLGGPAGQGEGRER
jgi:hypothetical protein